MLADAEVRKREQEEKVRKAAAQRAAASAKAQADAELAAQRERERQREKEYAGQAELMRPCCQWATFRVPPDSGLPPSQEWLHLHQHATLSSWQRYLDELHVPVPRLPFTRPLTCGFGA